MIVRQYRNAIRGMLAAGLLLSSPAMLFAQQTVETPKTHTVKKGDTLWDLAQKYLGDAFRWPELYRLNTDVVEDPHWIYPGEILKLPGYTAAELPGIARPTMGGDSVTPARPTAAVIDSNNLKNAPRRPSIFAKRGDQVQPVQPLIAAPSPIQRDTTPATPAAPVDTPRTVRPAVKHGDYVRAPWIDRFKGPPVWGRILGAADLPGIEPARQRGRFQLNDQILIAPPTGSVAPEHEMYLAYHNGPLIEEVGQVIVPTGVVEVLRPPVNGEAAIARVVKMFGEVNERDRLMPYDTSIVSITGTPTPIKNGREGDIRWIVDEPVLPSPQYYIVTSLTQTDGLKPGDEIELYQPRKKAPDEGDYATPEIKVGRAQIIRVTAFGSTAMITDLFQPKVEAKKTKVRVVAKMQ
jgi:LysM repeat protein